MPLRASTDDLYDLAQGEPELWEAQLERPSGVRLRGLLGVGGMSTVFMAERTLPPEATVLAPSVPDRLAVKFIKPSTLTSIEKLGMDPMDFFKKEAVALARLAERRPPCPFVVEYYGCGLTDVETSRGVRSLAWLALEYVDGGSPGTSLTDRVHNSGGGVDPVRALRLSRGIVEGLRALHAEGVIHRDLKPDNILLTGPVDDELPKLSDCGIARVEGMATNVMSAATPAYAGFEQMLPSGGMRNPLVGRWTDVHALSAVLWFIIAGEQWYQDGSGVDAKWVGGARRSLRKAQRLHPGFAADQESLSALDAVLSRGAAPRLPDLPVQAETTMFLQVLNLHYPSTRTGLERYREVDSFAADLFPILDRFAEKWSERAARESRPATVCRPTLAMTPSQFDKGKLPYEVVELPAKPAQPVDPTAAPVEVSARAIAFQNDGRALSCNKGRMCFFVDDQPFHVRAPDERVLSGARASDLAFVAYLGTLGYAVAGPSVLLLLRQGKWTKVPLPTRAQGEVGAIEACHGGRGRLAIITAETDDSEGGPELWTTTDGQQWSAPVAIPMNGGSIQAIAEGPYGMLFVGARQGKKARAAFLATDGSSVAYATGVGSQPPMTAAVCGNEREAWAASTAGITRFDRATAELEHKDFTDEGGPLVPTHMALDLVGLPWCVTDRSVLRREVFGTESAWRMVYRRSPGRAPLVAIAFTPDGARVMDAAGALVRITPPDVQRWQRAQAPAA